ncbi:hypothetical protein ILYODFUR_022914 [Ilyodon furcidens]|uniref:Uncharacterized protein n=1 Tax=Ilyodon furcidens TaxID=33524 RepID=A0ABV0SZD0_9TELE
MGQSTEAEVGNVFCLSFQGADGDGGGVIEGGQAGSVFPAADRGSSQVLGYFSSKWRSRVCSLLLHGCGGRILLVLQQCS